MSSPPVLPCRAVVEKKYDAAYPDPFLVKKGASVKILPAPEDWPGWHWCEAADGEKRWIPTEFLKVRGARGVLNRAYESTELTVQQGDKLTVLEITAGWAWCRTVDGNLGWLPVENLKTA